jgi:copper chaperone CopZ
MKKIKLKIEGMHCTSCAMNIDMDLEELDGVKAVNTSYAKQVSEVEFDESKLSMDQVLNQVKGTGYTAQVLE